jgi:hypothetical protein
MFGSRTTFAAVAAITLGALGVAAQTAAETKYANCGNSLKLVNPQPVYYWEYNDSAFYNVTYTYETTYCDSTIPVNYIRLTDYSTGMSYTCTRQQFASTRNTLSSQCVLTQYVSPSG